MKRVGEAEVIPILLRDCDWTATDYAQIQAVPSKGGGLIPVSQWEDKDAEFQKVVKGIIALI